MQSVSQPRSTPNPTVVLKPHDSVLAQFNQKLILGGVFVGLLSLAFAYVLTIYQNIQLKNFTSQMSSETRVSSELPDSSLVTSTLGFAIILLLFIAAVFAVFALIVNVYIKRIIIRPIKALEIRVHQLAEGDLDKQIHTNRHDEIGNLLNATERLRRSLKIAQAIAEPGLEWGEHVS